MLQLCAVRQRCSWDHRARPRRMARMQRPGSRPCSDWAEQTIQLQFFKLCAARLKDSASVLQAQAFRAGPLDSNVYASRCACLQPGCSRTCMPLTCSGWNAACTLLVELVLVVPITTAPCYPPCMPLRSQHRVSCGQSLRVEPTKASVADWIHHMLKCEFFTSCPRHRDQKKAEVSAVVV